MLEFLPEGSGTGFLHKKRVPESSPLPALLISCHHHRSLFFEPFDDNTFHAVGKIDSTGHSQSVHYLEPVPAICEETGLFEDGEVFGHVRNLGPHMGYYIANAHFTLL